MDVSTNVPRNTTRLTRAKAAKASPRVGPTHGHGHDENAQVTPSYLPFNRDIQELSDEGDDMHPATWTGETSIRSAHSLGSFPYATYSTPTHSESRSVFAMITV